MDERTLDRLDASRAVLLVVDLQDRLVPVMRESKTLVRRCARLIEGCRALAVPVVATEQYPKGLGRMVREIDKALDGVRPCEKTRFSACVQPVTDEIERLGRDQVIVAGIEAHVCVLQTCLDLLDRDKRVHLPWDATSSRRAIDRDAALRRLAGAGVLPTTVEGALFEMVREAGADAFAAVRDVIRPSD